MIPIAKTIESSLLSHFSELIKLDPVKLGTSEYAKSRVSTQITNFLANQLDQGEVDAWKLYQMLITTKK